MNTHINPARIHRLIGPKVVANKWNAQVKHQPMAIVTTTRRVRSEYSPSTCALLGVMAALEMIATFAIIFHLTGL